MMKKTLLSLGALVALTACAHHDDPASDPSSAASPNQPSTESSDAGVMHSSAAPKSFTNATPKAPAVHDAGTPPAALVADTTPTTTARPDDSPRLTPISQGNSAAETTITARIRRNVMADSSLGFIAKNVMIITVGTKVTLRGSVNSDRERGTIEGYAKYTPGVTDVDDQIQVNK